MHLANTHLAKALSAAGLAAALVALAAPPAGAQTRNIRIVVPYTPGSGPDIVSRLMAEQIGRMHGHTLVVENRPGGGTLIGTEMAARAEPDGNTVLLVGNSYVVNPALKPQPYDVATTFAAVCQLAATPLVMVVKGDSPYRTLDDLLKAAREKPGQLALASGGPGSALHVAFEVVKRAAKVDMTYVPFGGTAPSINALMGGHVATVFADYPTVVSQLKAGTLRGLVTTSPQRSPGMPDVPTLRETGLSNYEAEIFYGIVAPAKTPPDAIAQLSGWFSSALKAPEMAPKFAAQGLFPADTCGAPFAAFLNKMVDDYKRTIAEAGIKTP